MIRDRFLQTWKEKMGTDEWLILQDHYDPEENLKYESLFALSNGYLGIRGSYEEVTLRDFYKGKDFREDYLHIILTDEEDVPDGAAKLRLIYPNLMKLSYDNRRTQNQAQWEEMGPTEEKSPLAMLEEFYEKQNGQPMQETQRSFALGLMEESWEDEACDR